jgi:hypothetical protein
MSPSIRIVRTRVPAHAQARSFIMIEPMINRIEATQIAAGTVVGKFMPAPRISSLAQTWQLPSFDYLIIGPLK